MGICFVTFSVSDAGISVSCLLFTEHQDQPVLIKHASSDTKPSKVMLSTVSVYDVEAANDQCQREPPMVNQGVNQLKFARSLQSVAEERAGRQCGALRVLNSYWVAQDSTYKYFEIIMVDPMHKAIRRDTQIKWICDSTMKHRENRFDFSWKEEPWSW